MSLITPDNFKDQPYVAGLNQLGHIVFGAGIMSIAAIFLPIVLAGLVSGLVVIVVEVGQLRILGAQKADYFQDTFFWFLGFYFFDSYWLPVVAVTAGGLWMGVVWLRSK